MRRAATAPLTIVPVGWVAGGRKEAVDDDWGEVAAMIRLDERRFGPEALAGLDQFSHLDAVDGTPVIDIKPYIAELGPRWPASPAAPGRVS